MSCIVCNSDRTETVGRFDDWLQVITSKADGRAQIIEITEKLNIANDYGFIRCRACNAMFVDPMPAAGDLAKFYQQGYASERYGWKKAKKLKRAGRRMKKIRARYGGRTFIDIGCSLGYAVESARLQGYDAHGFDIDRDSIEAAQIDFPRCSFTNQPLSELSQGANTYDVVYCSDVVEHATDPQEFFACLANLTAPNGLLYLATPDFGHIRVPKDVFSWEEVKPPEHVVWFSKQSLTHLANANGFNDLRFQFNLKPGIRFFARR